MDKFLETAKAKTQSSSGGTIIGIVLGVIGVIGGAIIAYIYYKCKKSRKDKVFTTINWIFL